MSRDKTVFHVAIAVSLLIAGASQAAVYYVSPSGDNQNPGTIDLPWRTIQKGADTAVAGDTVYVREGVYTEEIYPQRSGNKNAWITYMPYRGERAVLDGDDYLPDQCWGGLFHLWGCSYIRIQGFHAVNSAYAGLFADNCSHITFSGNLIENSWASGVLVIDSNNIVVENNIILRACQGDGSTQECLTMKSVNTFLVTGNLVADRLVDVGHGGEGIDAKGACSNGQIVGNVVRDLIRVGIYVDGRHETGHNIEISRNVVYNTFGGVVLSAEYGTGSLENISILNNVLYNNRYHGVLVSDWSGGMEGGGDGSKTDILIANNTTYNNGEHSHVGFGGGIAITSENPANSGLVIRNNICSENGQWQIIRVSTDTLVENNLIEGPNDLHFGNVATTDGLNPVLADPEFVREGLGNFHLQQTSPAIDAGSPLQAPSDDHDRKPRPVDGNGDGQADWDIGAYEFAPPPTRSRHWSLYE